jgi:hypothetical protein
MNMLVRTIRYVSIFAAILTLAVLPHPAYSQTAGGRSALAAKQKLKNHVLDAMADSKISKLERAEILMEGKELLTVKEYEGLQVTMDRLSPRETVAATAKRSAAERAIAATKQDREASPKFLGRLVASVPYLDDFSIGPHPQVGNLARSVPYAKSPVIDPSAADRALAKVPRISETYVDQPTADRPLPKITRVERASGSVRIAARPASPNKNPIPGKLRSKYFDESITPVPPETEPVMPNMGQRQYQAARSTDPLAGTPYLEQDSSDRAIPTAAILSDDDLPQTGDSLQLAQPKGVESEYLK